MFLNKFKTHHRSRYKTLAKAEKSNDAGEFSDVSDSSRKKTVLAYRTLIKETNSGDKHCIPTHFIWFYLNSRMVAHEMLDTTIAS